MAVKIKYSYLEWLICLCYLGLLFPTKVSNVFLILLLVYSLICTNFNQMKAAWKDSLPLKLICIYFFLHLIGILYTTNIKAGTFILEKKMALILIPAIVFPHLFFVSNEERDSLLKKIGVLTMLASLIILGVAYFKYYILNDSTALYFENFAPIHYVYYALYFAFGSLLFLNSFFDSLYQKKWGLILWLLAVIYSLGILFIVSSKMGIISFLLGAVLLLYFRVSKKVFLISCILLIASVIAFSFIHETTRERFIELGLNFELLKVEQFEYKEGEQFTGFNLRLLFWKYSISHLWEQGAYLVGVGTGDAQDFIDESYKIHNLTVYDYTGWDPHNQWVFTTIQLGILGLMSFLAIYVSGFIVAFRTSYFGLLIFLLITFCFSLTESILESNKGIVFFALFFVVLFSQQKQEASKN